jgi:amino acid adenylation domain-containing protein
LLNLIHSNSLLNERLYWREILRDLSSETSLPLDYKRSLSWHEDYEVKEFELSPEVCSSLLNLSQSNPLSLLIFLTSAWTLLNHIYTADTDIAIGLPSYSKKGPSKPVEENLVCLRVQIDRFFSFKSLLLLVRERLISAFNHQTLPYEDVLAEVGLQKKRNRSVPFSSIVWHTKIQVDPNLERYRSDILLTIESDEKKIKLKLKYNKSLFCPESINYLALHFQQLLISVTQNIDEPVGKHSCMIEQENEFNLTNVKNANIANSPKLMCIHHFFENIVEIHPHRIAVQQGERSLSYRELNQKANQLANYLLKEKRVSPGQVVAFVGEKSIEYCIAILGILKSGCAFLPIDYSQPTKRLTTILKDSKTQIVIAKDEICKIISRKEELFDSTFDWIALDNLERLYKDYPSECTNPQTEIDSSFPAYMIYTSGSTGQPKGVLISHNGKMNHILSSHQSYSFTIETSCLFSASISSDISIWQGLVAMLSGGKTIIIDDESLFDHLKFWTFLQSNAVMLAQFVPSFFESHLNMIESNKSDLPLLTHLKFLILAGEEPSSKLINSCLELLPNIVVVNAYGPSEASDIVTQHHFSTPIYPNINHLPIGRPITNVFIFVLDSEKRIQPFFVPGEIYVAGVAVGLGYWNNPEKNLSSFVDPPYQQVANQKWYRTGDIGRYLSDGSIEYMGRRDSQVKIRGFRVELEEIEYCLQSNENVKKCVLYTKVKNHQVSLFACVVPEKLIQQLNLEDLRLSLMYHLRDHLPEHMIPQYITFVDALPKLSNGKIDLGALPNPDFESYSSFSKPKNPIECRVAQITSELVGIPFESVNMKSNFFDLGGTSIHLMAMKYQIHKQLALDIPIEELFNLNSLQELSEKLKELNLLNL